MYIDLIRPGIFCYGRCYQFSWGRGNELTTSLPCPSKKCTFRKFAYKIPLYKITIQSLYRAILLVLEVSRCSCISCCEEHREAKWRILIKILLLTAHKARKRNEILFQSYWNWLLVCLQMHYILGKVVVVVVVV